VLSRCMVAQCCLLKILHQITSAALHSATLGCDVSMSFGCCFGYWVIVTLTIKYQVK